MPSLFIAWWGFARKTWDMKKRVLVTGASTGIGYAISEALVANSFHVIAGVRKPSDLKRLQKIGCETIGFSGRDGGEMNTLCTINIVVPAEDTPRIQEMHILIGHTICHLIDRK